MHKIMWADLPSGRRWLVKVLRLQHFRLVHVATVITKNAFLGVVLRDSSRCCHVHRVLDVDMERSWRKGRFRDEMEKRFDVMFAKTCINLGLRA